MGEEGDGSGKLLLADDFVDSCGVNNTRAAGSGNMSPSLYCRLQLVAAEGRQAKANRGGEAVGIPREGGRLGIRPSPALPHRTPMQHACCHAPMQNACHSKHAFLIIEPSLQRWAEKETGRRPWAADTRLTH